MTREIWIDVGNQLTAGPVTSFSAFDWLTGQVGEEQKIRKVTLEERVQIEKVDKVAQKLAWTIMLVSNTGPKNERTGDRQVASRIDDLESGSRIKSGCRMKIGCWIRRGRCMYRRALKLPDQVQEWSWIPRPM